jgi:DNA repair protein RecN (Recombination protein N)
MTELRFASSDIAEQLRDYRETLDFSPGELEDIEWRLDVIYKLKQKYGSSVSEILEFLEAARQKLDSVQFFRREVGKA